MQEFHSDYATQFINTQALDVALNRRNYFQSCYGEKFLHVCSRSLSSLFQRVRGLLDGLAYIEKVTNQYSNYLINAVEDTENILSKVKLSLISTT